MNPRAKVLAAGVLTLAGLVTLRTSAVPGQSWVLFWVYLTAALLSSGMKVSLLGSDSTMSVNFPFILLAVMELSPLQAIAIAAVSVFAQCKFRVHKLFSVIQILFNVANAVNATALCWFAYAYLHRAHLAAAPSLALGASLYFLVNTIPVAAIVAWTSNRKWLPIWRQTFAWFWPFYLFGAALSVLAHFLGTRFGAETAILVLPVAYIIYRSYNAQVARIRDQERHVLEMEALHLRTIESLAMAIEAKDQDTHDHLLRVRVYVTELAAALQLSKPEVDAVRTAALLHDIGKLAVPERIINKPGKLTQEEFEKMKIHPVVGADILERVRFPYPVVPIVRAHHEWWNGMGYPDGLQGEAIPIGARILTVVDSFDAMASDRPYRKAMPLPEAMAIVKKLSGTQFDPQVVDVLEENYVRLEAQARREGEEIHRLATEVKVARGVAPGAGFEQESPGSDSAPEQVPKAGVGEGHVGLSAPHLAEALALQANSLLGITELPGYALNLDETLSVLGFRLSGLIPFEHLILFLDKDGELTPQRIEKHTARFFQAAPVLRGEGISGWAALHQHSIVNGNPTVEPNYLAQRTPEEDLKSALSLPLRVPGKSLLGVLTLYSAAANAFSREHLRALQDTEAIIALALQNSMQVPAPMQDARVTVIQSSPSALAGMMSRA